MSNKIEDHAFPSWCEACDPEPTTEQDLDTEPTVILEARRPASGGRHRPENINPPSLGPAPMSWQEKGRLIVEAVYIAGAVAIVAVVGAMIVVGLVWGWA